jgi:hypothetical protein
MSISCVENLSNEIFHEIFEYLNGCDVYETFSNLNNRFEEILHCSSLRFKIKNFGIILNTLNLLINIKYFHLIFGQDHTSNNFFQHLSSIHP